MIITKIYCKKTKLYCQDRCIYNTANVLCLNQIEEEYPQCDICGLPIDDWAESYEDYHNPETGKDICKSCRKKYERE